MFSLIKTERFKGSFLLSTAQNISHSSAILQGAQSLWKGSVLSRSLEINQRGGNVVVKQILGIIGRPRERCLPQNLPLSLVPNLLSSAAPISFSIRWFQRHTSLSGSQVF